MNYAGEIAVSDQARLADASAVFSHKNGVAVIQQVGENDALLEPLEDRDANWRPLSRP